ncbi:hypothetical protein [Jannaschia aquimarina]|nr:hypothetical protein [Jannaschia aquimarina]
MLLLALAGAASAQSDKPEYEIIDVRILTYLPERGWISGEFTSGFIRANKKDWQVSLGRGWVGIEGQRFVQSAMTLQDITVLMGIPNREHDPEAFPFVPELAGPYIGEAIFEDGDPFGRRWYLEGADTTAGSFILPVGTNLMRFDAYQLEGAPKQQGAAWWIRLIFYESKEGIIELEPSPPSESEGFDFDNPEDIARGETTPEEDAEYLKELEAAEAAAEAEGFDFDDPEDIARRKTDAVEWQRDMSDDQKAEAQELYDGLISCAEIGSGCPDGYEADILKAGLETDPDGFSDTIRGLAEDVVLGVETTEEGWPKSIPKHEAEEAQADYERVQGCVEGRTSCPDYLDAETVRLFFELADPNAADATNRDIIVDHVSRRYEPDSEE